MGDLDSFASQVFYELALNSINEPDKIEESIRLLTERLGQTMKEIPGESLTPVKAIDAFRQSWYELSKMITYFLLWRRKFLRIRVVGSDEVGNTSSETMKDKGHATAKESLVPSEINRYVPNPMEIVRFIEQPLLGLTGVGRHQYLHHVRSVINRSYISEPDPLQPLYEITSVRDPIPIVFEWIDEIAIDQESNGDEASTTEESTEQSMHFTSRVKERPKRKSREFYRQRAMEFFRLAHKVKYCVLGENEPNTVVIEKAMKAINREHPDCPISESTAMGIWYSKKWSMEYREEYEDSDREVEWEKAHRDRTYFCVNGYILH